MKQTHPSKIGYRAIGLGALALAALAPWVGFAAGNKQGQPEHRRTTDPPIASKGKLGQDLFLAVEHRNVEEVETLLKKGADPNSRNGLEFTPLYIAAASHQPDVMKALLAAKAQPHAESPYGTALTFAAMGGHAEGARILLGKNADPNFARVDGATVLMMAAQSGNPELVGEILKAKAKVNEASYSGATPLSYAARGGHVAVGQMLLDAKAKVDSVDDYGQTPLMVAAQAGHAEFVKLLLEKGAKPNLRDAKGRTALMLASAYADNDEVEKALLAKGADPKLKDKKGRTAADLESRHDGAAPVSKRTQEAIQQSLKLLEGSMTAFSNSTQCISCHQEGLGRMVSASAKSKGFKTDPALNQAQLGRIRGALGALKPLHEAAVKSPEAMKQVPLIEINEVNPGFSWMMAGMAAQNDTPTAATAAAALVLARQQTPDGAWTFSLPRVPMQSSIIGMTALAARSIQKYGPKAEAAEIADRLGKAKDWLQKAPAKSSDDLAFRLLGLKWTGATMEEREAAIEGLLAAQRLDGGWAQMPNMASDAYATGQALYALRVAGGVAKDDAAFQKGIKYLLRTQDDDGSWFVNKRAIPANNYFDAKFPHGESQYASFNGTSWAVMALLESLK